MKMDRVLIETVIGRKVHSPAEPPRGIGAFLLRDKKANVHVHGRHERIDWMEHQRHPQHFEGAPGKLWPSRARRRRQLVTVDVREIDAAAFEYIALLDHTGDSAAAFGPLPDDAHEGLAVDRSQPLDNPRLQVGEVKIGRASW